MRAAAASTFVWRYPAIGRLAEGEVCPSFAREAVSAVAMSSSWESWRAAVILVPPSRSSAHVVEPLLVPLLRTKVPDPFLAKVSRELVCPFWRFDQYTARRWVLRGNSATQKTCRATQNIGPATQSVSLATRKTPLVSPFLRLVTPLCSHLTAKTRRLSENKGLSVRTCELAQNRKFGPSGLPSSSYRAEVAV